MMQNSEVLKNYPHYRGIDTVWKKEALLFGSRFVQTGSKLPESYQVSKLEASGY